ncbi:AAA family ATPase [Trinickia sp.]|uniref:AAA family ATPase n=1 Tax=Trinickia sp. TaxID=2571163 RepID=UPI003F820553
MQYLKFRIRNFRGIEDLAIDLGRNPQASVFTIVGLNESGKTTVLEGISQMGRSPMNLLAPDPSRRRITQFDSFIPVSERYNFNGTTVFSTVLKFSDSDRQGMRKFLLEKLGVIPVNGFGETLTINRRIHYKNSNFEKEEITWNIDPAIRKPKGRKIGVLSTMLGQESWLNFINYIEEKMLPPILYFRSEAFDFPGKIIIWAKPIEDRDESNSRTKSINGFYREVVEDILRAIDPTLTISEHIVDRKKSPAERDGQHLASLLHKMSAHVTRTVMEQWEKIFQRTLSNKNVVVSCDYDEGGNIYLRFAIQDGSQLFDLSDRSAGFRWFFSFIVLTSYRGAKMDSALFLYDEPASNLHSSAQRQLVDCFRGMPEHFKAIYTTHSHYLINPEWLDATFVSQNLGVAPDGLSDNFDSTQTDVRLTPYRQFVSENPSRVSYFQPVLDVLQYTPSRLEPIKSAVLVEGKNDYYGLRYFLTVCLSMSIDFDLIPCVGSGTADQLLALYTGWGKRFTLLLDSDKAGTTSKARYIDKFGSLVFDRIKTYGDINAAWDDFGLEKIIGESDLEIIQNLVYPSTKFNKKTVWLAIQELLIKGIPVELSKESRENLILIHAELNELSAV